MNLLSSIQTRLKCNKGQFNSFGKYSYRSLEDIFEGLKPLLKEFECAVTVSDDVQMIGDRIYIKATANLINKEGVIVATNNGWARESLQKKGMDDSQITGTASSYARKYAMNGLFAIDDTKDADTDQYQNVQGQQGGQNNGNQGNHQVQQNNGYNQAQNNNVNAYPNNNYNNANQQQNNNYKTRQIVPNQQQFGNQNQNQNQNQGH